MPLKHLHTVFKSELVRNSGKLLSANIVAQAIGLLIYPLLTRIYTQADFGLLNLFMSIAGIIVIISTGAYHNAVPLPKDEGKAQGVFHTGVACVVITTLCLCMLLPLRQPIANLFNAGEIARYLWLMPIYVFFMGLWQMLNYWFTRQKAYRHISGYQINQTLLTSISKLGLGELKIAGGLLYGATIAPGLSVLLSIALGWKKHLCSLLHCNKTDIKDAAKQYRNFPIYILPKSLINSLSVALPALLLTPVFGLTELGYWSMAVTLAFTPVMLILRSFYQVLFQETAVKVQQNELIKQRFIHLVKIVIFIVIPCFVALFFILPQLTSWLLGSSWERTGVYIRMMSPWLTATCIGNLMGFIPDIFAKQKISTIIECVYAILRAGTLVIGIYLHSAYIALLGYCLTGAVVVCGQIVWYFSLIQKYEKSIHSIYNN